MRSGDVYGPAFVDPFLESPSEMPYDSILVAVHPKADLSRYIRRCKAVITDQGGIGCHAAIVAREFETPA